MVNGVLVPTVSNGVERRISCIMHREDSALVPRVAEGLWRGGGVLQAPRRVDGALWVGL